MSLLPLALKAATTAAVVVAAALVAERARPFIAAMVLSLPVSTGPAYVVLALDHDAAFVAEAALTSIAGNVTIAPAVAAYAAAASRGAGLAAAMAAFVAAWIATACAALAWSWTLPQALALNAGVFGLAIALTWRWRHGPPPRAPARRWYDVPLRAGLVALVVVAVVLASERAGPAAAGIAALFPASYTSFILLMHRRLGGPAVAAALVNGLLMLIGFIGMLAAIHVFAAAGRAWTGIAVGFAVPVAWTLAVFAANRLRAS